MSSDKTRGIYQKYHVERTDGSSVPGGKHYSCEYYVMDVMHDKHAAPALRAYTDSCEAEFPELAKDIRARWLSALNLQESK